MRIRFSQIWSRLSIFHYNTFDVGSRDVAALFGFLRFVFDRKLDGQLNVIHDRRRLVLGHS